MALGPRHIVSLATALAVLLAMTSLGPATAAEVGISRVMSAEQYAHSLLNCTRTGGWVKADGTCVDRGTGKYSAYRRPLRLHAGISRKVAWRWARAMVRHDACAHSIAGLPSLRQRLNRKGFTHPTYGENIGCGWGYGDPKDVVLMTHRSFQAEKAAGGAHWRNIKSKGYKSVGVGVATREGRTMVVYDFYGRRW